MQLHIIAFTTARISLHLNNGKIEHEAKVLLISFTLCSVVVHIISTTDSMIHYINYKIIMIYNKQAYHDQLCSEPAVCP